MTRSARGGFFDLRQQRLDRVGDGDDVGAGLAFHVEDQRWLAIVPSCELLVFKAIEGLADIVEFDRGAADARCEVAGRRAGWPGVRAACCSGLAMLR